MMTKREQEELLAALATRTKAMARRHWPRARKTIATAIVGTKNAVWILVTMAAPQTAPIAAALRIASWGCRQTPTSRPVVAVLSKVANVSFETPAAR